MSEPIDIASRLEPLFDASLIESFAGGATQRLHRPTPREVVLKTDRPWEGNMCGYVTVLQDGDQFRMYYKGWAYDIAGGVARDVHGMHICMATSDDGVNWTRPNVGSHPFEGDGLNNIVFNGVGDDQLGIHGFAPFIDTHPDCKPAARYKAVGGVRKATTGGLYAMTSPDGVTWSLLQDQPIITAGKFDSQNLAFYDSVRGEYRAYIRDFREGRRCIKTCTSPDFYHWSTPQWLDYPGSPDEQLYTNQVMPYPRAPHLYVGFPTRYVERPWSDVVDGLPEVEHRKQRAAVSERYGSATSDGLFMTSRDGQTFSRWGEAFLRPGPQLEGSWTYGDMYQGWGLLETPASLPGAQAEWSLYATEHYWRGDHTLFRRYSIRMDGFVSVNAPLTGGEIVTRPLVFAGDVLELNVSTSAAGRVRAELQSLDGKPIPGFSLDDCVDVVGDRIDFPVRWKQDALIGKLAGQPVRLRLAISDADVYAFRM